MRNGAAIRLLRPILICVGLQYGAMVSAAVSITGLDPIRINAWAGTTSDLTGSDTYCTISCSGACNSTRRRSSYDAAFYTSGTTDGAGNFYITNGTHSLMVFLDWIHPVSGTTRMTNYNVTYSPSPIVDGAYSCSADGNSQTRIDITLPAGQIASARAGTYTETFAVDICRLSGGSYAECSAQFPFSVTLPELIQVTNLANVDLGLWSGTGDIQKTQDFCVFRNGQGGFAVTTNGSNDAGGKFRFGSSSGLPYTIEYGQSGVFTAVAPGATLAFSASGFAGNSVRDCADTGGTNTSIRFTVSETDLAAHSSGRFSDTVNISVLPD